MTSFPETPFRPGTTTPTGHYDETATRWYDDRLRCWLPLTEQVELLTIVLEVDGTMGWTSDPDAERSVGRTSPRVPAQRSLRAVDGRDGSAWPGGTLMRFVGRPTSSTRGVLPPEVHGTTFLRLRPVTGDHPPDESHCPGMNDALLELRHRLVGQGWIETGRRGHPWSFRYHRQVPDWSAAPA
jgi:hypothetical protein